MEIVVTNSRGTDRQTLVLTSMVQAVTAVWGRSVLDVIGESEVLGFTSRAHKDTITEGVYAFPSGNANEFLYVWTADSIGDPGNRSAGKGWMAGAFLSAMATPGEGYTSEINGWNYLPLTVDGQAGRLWRSLNPSAGSQTWTVTQ
jgi:hypothetical protein